MDEDTVVVVRRAVAPDAPGIARCQGACWREAYADLAPRVFDDRPDGIGADRWAQAVAAPGVVVAVAVAVASSAASSAAVASAAVAHDEVVGLASAGPPPPGGEPDGSDPPRDRQLHAIYLRSALHGRGLGARLLDASLEPGPAFLWVLEDNPRARAFYARHGFRPDGASAVDGWTGLREVRLVR